MNNILVKKFYNNNPYPNIPLFANVKIPAGFIEDAFKSVELEQIEYPEILLVGCGTVAPLAFQMKYPDSNILAVDISDRTLEIAKKKCKSGSKISFKCVDLADDNLVNNLDGKTFDYIHCTGVLHHLDKPEKGIDNLSKLLSNDGIIRFQIYSKGARIWIEWLRTLLISRNVEKVSQAKEIMTALSRYHPFRFVLSTYPESLNLPGFKDGFLHPVVNTYYASEWEGLFNKFGLSISFWDKENLINDAEDILPEKYLEDFCTKSISEKITFLEKIGEWRSDFSGIITKNGIINTENSFLVADNREFIIPSSDTISYPRFYLWNLFKEAIYDLEYDFSINDIKYILDNLSERCFSPGIEGLMLRFKWSAWNDKCRIFASNSFIFEENKDVLIKDYFDNKEKSIYIPSSDTWQWEQWQNGFFAWEW